MVLKYGTAIFYSCFSHWVGRLTVWSSQVRIVVEKDIAVQHKFMMVVPMQCQIILFCTIEHVVFFILFNMLFESIVFSEQKYSLPPKCHISSKSFLMGNSLHSLPPPPTHTHTIFNQEMNRRGTALQVQSYPVKHINLFNCQRSYYV